MGIFDTVQITLTTVRCYNCGVLFGIESGRRQELIESHDLFWCPNGHSQHYTEQTEKEKQIAALERDLRTANSSRQFWNEQAAEAQRDVERKSRSINGYKGVIAKTKKRIAAGTCPCCSAKFKNLEQHMKARHPNWNPEKGADALAAKAKE